MTRKGRDGRGRRGGLRRACGVVLGLVVLAGCADALATMPIPEAPAPTAPGDGFPALSSMIDDHRRSLGCGPLTWHGGAAEAARRHSEDMADRGYFSHESPEGRTLADRLSALSIAYTAAAENIAVGQRSEEEVFAAWLESSGHRASIETCGYTHHGLGRAGNYWTLVLIAPR